MPSVKITRPTEKIQRIKTGIPGFDSLMKTGIPIGSATLIEGGPGSGKTIFCLQTAYNACKRGQKVLYMSFEEPERRLISHMINFGWDPKKFIDSGLFVIRRFSALDIARSVEALLSEAKKELLIDIKPMFFPRDFKPNFVLVDSLSSIASAFSGHSSRFRIYMEQLFKYLEGESITSFLIRETPNPSHLGIRTGQEEAVSFLADGIVVLYNVLTRSTGRRTGGIEIIKMRGEEFTKKIVKLDIINKKGIEVYPNDDIVGEYVLT